MQTSYRANSHPCESDLARELAASPENRGLQQWVTRLMEPPAEVVGLRVAITLWVAGYLVVPSAIVPTRVRTIRD
jgi:hypothetical protein